jgi:hypothetical protein
VPQEIATSLRRGRAAFLATALIAGCAPDEAAFPAGTSVAYQADLESCQSAAARAQAANSAEGFFTGALIGAAHGAAAGAHRGGADVGAIVGASLGAVVGFVEGLHWSRGTSIAACMQSRGYRRI